jgi:hypothetical protein
MSGKTSIVVVVKNAIDKRGPSGLFSLSNETSREVTLRARRGRSVAAVNASVQPGLSLPDRLDLLANTIGILCVAG